MMKEKVSLWKAPSVLLYFILTLDSLFCSNHFSVASDVCPQQGKWPWGYHKLGDQDFCYMIIDHLVSDCDKAQAMCNEQGAGLVLSLSIVKNKMLLCVDI